MSLFWERSGDGIYIDRLLFRNGRALKNPRFANIDVGGAEVNGLGLDFADSFFFANTGTTAAHMSGFHGGLPKLCEMPSQ